MSRSLCKYDLTWFFMQRSDLRSHLRVCIYCNIIVSISSMHMISTHTPLDVLLFNWHWVSTLHQCAVCISDATHTHTATIDMSHMTIRQSQQKSYVLQDSKKLHAQYQLYQYDNINSHKYSTVKLRVHLSWGSLWAAHKQTTIYGQEWMLWSTLGLQTHLN